MSEANKNIIELELKIIQSTKSETIKARDMIARTLKKIGVNTSTSSYKLSISNATSYNVAESIISDLSEFDTDIEAALKTNTVKFVSFRIVGKVSEDLMKIFKESFSYIPEVSADEVI